MAEAKTTTPKKTTTTSKAAKPAPKKTTVITSTKSTAEQITEKRAEYLELKKSHAAGELVNPRALTHTRKEIARLMTKQSQEKSNAEKEAK